jgi:hypothetical protein
MNLERVTTALRLGPARPDRDALLDKVLAFLNRPRTWPERVRAGFRHPDAAAIQGPGH